MDDIILARFFDDHGNKPIEITQSEYDKMRNNQDKVSIADFIYQRLTSRYIKPYCYNDTEYKQKYKNGFAMMASLCLLVETLQSFKNGWEDNADHKSADAFKQFFQDNKHFPELKDKGKDIYKNVRCGILHQGETTGGWKITRKNKKLYDSNTNTLDAVVFAEKMNLCITDYCDNLKQKNWDSEIWDNFRTKMRKIIKNSSSAS